LIFFLLIFGAPVAYAVVLLTLVVKREWRGLGLSLLFAAGVVASAVWAMDQSRSSTRGLAFLGFPLMATLGGFLGLAFGRYRSSSDVSRRIGAWLGLAGTLALIGFNISGGLKEKTKNKGRDATQEAFRAEIFRDRDTITAALKANPGRERAWLDSSVRTRMTDRAFLLAALPNDSMPPGLLDTLANSPDLNIALEAVRNPNTRPETLEHVYRTKTYPDYFFQALAAHHNTPPSVLLELYRRPRTIMMLDIWFAGNPSTPHEVLDQLSRTATDRSIIAALLENPSLDCGMLTRVAITLLKKQDRDADNPNVARMSELVPKLCPGKYVL
jgi:hypothetical protein